MATFFMKTSDVPTNHAPVLLVHLTTIETSVLLTKVEELFEDNVQPLICKFRQWGCDASPTFKYWDMFLVAVQIMLSNVRAERERDWSAHLMSTIPPEPFKSYMMFFSVSISLQLPLKLPDVCLMNNSPFSKADFISAERSSISSIYTYY
jgi:hypothetical protein